MKQQPPPPPEQPQPQQQHHHHQQQKQQQQQARRHIDVSAGYSIEAAVLVSSGGASASQRSHLGGRFGSLYAPDPDPDPDPAAADEDEDEDEDEDDGVAHDNSRTLVFAGMTPDDIHRQRGGNGTNPHLLPGSPAAARARSVDSTDIAGRQRAALASLPVPSPSRESHRSSVNSGSNNNGGGGGGSKRAMSEGGAGVIGQIGQMYGALQDEMQSLESEYVRLKAHLQDDYTRQYRGLETALAASEQRLTHTRARTRELQSTAHAERQALARERRDAEAVTESAGRAHAEAERAMAAAKSVGAREAAVSEREATIAAAGHELASRSASFERSRDDADRRWTELECQLTAERATLDSRRAELDTEYDKCVATKDALRAEGELAGQDLHRRSALVKETELRLDGDIRAFESARGEQQAQLDEHKCKVREQAEAGLWARPPRGGKSVTRSLDLLTRTVPRLDPCPHPPLCELYVMFCFVTCARQ
jgi:IS1 family transposase